MPRFEHDGLTIHYEDLGDPGAPAIVLLHDTGTDSRMWPAVVGPLAAGYRVITVDLRGHGGSFSPGAPADWTLEDFAADVAALLGHVEVDFCVLVGCGFGGAVALQFAVTWPGNLAGLVLSDTSAAPDHPALDDACRAWRASVLLRAATLSRLGAGALARTAASEFHDPFLAGAFRSWAAHLSVDGWVGAAHALETQPDLLPRLADTLAMPVMLCTGAEGPHRSAMDVIADVLPEARYLTFRDIGGPPPIEAAGVFAHELARFCADIEDGRRIDGRRTVG